MFRAEGTRCPEEGTPDLHAARRQRSARLHVHSNHRDVHGRKTARGQGVSGERKAWLRQTSMAGLIQLIRWRLETVEERACVCRCLRVFGAVPWIGRGSPVTYVARECPVLLCNLWSEACRLKRSLELRWQQAADARRSLGWLCSSALSLAHRHRQRERKAFICRLLQLHALHCSISQLAPPSLALLLLSLLLLLALSLSLTEQHTRLTQKLP